MLSKDIAVLCTKFFRDELSTIKAVRKEIERERDRFVIVHKMKNDYTMSMSVCKCASMCFCEHIKNPSIRLYLFCVNRLLSLFRLTTVTI